MDNIQSFFVLIGMAAIMVLLWSVYMIIKCKNSNVEKVVSKPDFRYPYKFVHKNYGIIEVYERIDTEWVLTGRFNSIKQSMELVCGTEDTMLHLMDLFFGKEV